MKGREEGTQTGNEDAPSLLLRLARFDPQTAQQQGCLPVGQHEYASAFTSQVPPWVPIK